MELNHRKIIYRIFPLLAILLFMFIAGCKVTYSFTGASISPLAKTFSVQYFQNRASLVQVGLSQNITEALIDKCRTQTKLKYTTNTGDVNFDGEIKDYNTRPLTVSAEAVAATNRFSITVHVKFTNTLQPEFSFDQDFSRYQDYSANVDLSAVEKSLSDQIVRDLVEDIFNKAFVNW